MTAQLNENLEALDLEDLVSPIIRVDKHKSKVGNDRDIIVMAFNVKSSEAAEDLVSFLEKGYTEIIDADNVSSENIDGDFVVFVESERNKEFPKMIAEVLEGVEKLTGNDEWKFKHYKSEKTLSSQELMDKLPLTPEEYDVFLAKQKDIMQQLEQLKINARIPFK